MAQIPGVVGVCAEHSPAPPPETPDADDPRGPSASCALPSGMVRPARGRGARARVARLAREGLTTRPARRHVAMLTAQTRDRDRERSASPPAQLAPLSRHQLPAKRLYVHSSRDRECRQGVVRVSAAAAASGHSTGKSPPWCAQGDLRSLPISSARRFAPRGIRRDGHPGWSAPTTPSAPPLARHWPAGIVRARARAATSPAPGQPGPAHRDRSR